LKTTTRPAPSKRERNGKGNFDEDRVGGEGDMKGVLVEAKNQGGDQGNQSFKRSKEIRQRCLGEFIAGEIKMRIAVQGQKERKKSKKEENQGENGGREDVQLEGRKN